MKYVLVYFGQQWAPFVDDMCQKQVFHLFIFLSNKNNSLYFAILLNLSTINNYELFPNSIKLDCRFAIVARFALVSIVHSLCYFLIGSNHVPIPVGKVCLNYFYYFKLNKPLTIEKRLNHFYSNLSCMSS